MALSLMGEPNQPSTGTVTLAWDRVTDSSVTEVRVYYGLQPGTYFGYFAASGQAVQCSISGLERGEKYFFVAVAYNGLESKPSNEVECQIESPPIRRNQITNLHELEN